MVKARFVESNGRRKWAVLPYDEFLRLIEQAEMNEDVKDYDEMKAAVESGDEEVFSSEALYNMLVRSKTDYMRIHVNLEKSQIQLLDEIAKKVWVSRSELVREYIDAQLFSHSKDSWPNID